MNEDDPRGFHTPLTDDVERRLAILRPGRDLTQEIADRKARNQFLEAIAQALHCKTVLP